KSRDHAVTILSRHILRREHCMHSGIRADELFEIAEFKLGAMIRRANHPQHQCSNRYLIVTEDFGSINLSLTINPDKPLSHCCSSLDLQGRSDFRLGLPNCSNNLAISGATAE